MKSVKQTASQANKLFIDLNITINPKLDNINKKGTERKLEDAKRFLAKVKFNTIAK